MKQKQDNKLKLNIIELMKKKEFVMFINFCRIATLIGVVVLIVYMIVNVEAVKMLANPCRICMDKTGCQCFCLKP